MNSEPTNKPTASRQRTRKPTPKPKRKIGRPTKASPERIQGILASIARGLTREQACAVNDVSDEAFTQWERRPEFLGLREKALGARANLLLSKIESEPAGWQRFAWLLERPKSFRDQFADPLKLHIGSQQNNYTVTAERAAEIDAQRRRVMALVEGEQTARRSVQSENHEETSDRWPVIREIEGPAGPEGHQPASQAPRLIRHSDDFAPPEKPESARERVAQPGDSMRASDMDWSSGQRKRRSENDGDHQVSQAPPEPEHVRQRDKKPPVGPLSERQRQLAQERARRGGDGKRPF